jgi:hypothetical protein
MADADSTMNDPLNPGASSGQGNRHHRGYSNIFGGISTID